MKKSKSTTPIGFILLVVPLILFLLFLVYPIIVTIFYSLHKTIPYIGFEFRGLQNFTEFFRDPFQRGLIGRMFLALFSWQTFGLIVGPIATGLLLLQLRSKARNVFQAFLGLLLITTSPLILDFILSSFYCSSDLAFTMAKSLKIEPVCFQANLALGKFFIPIAQFISSLSFAVPLGALLVISAWKGNNGLITDESGLYQRFLRNSWRLIIVMAGFTMAATASGYETIFLLKNPITHRYVANISLQAVQNHLDGEYSKGMVGLVFLYGLLMAIGLSVGFILEKSGVVYSIHLRRTATDPILAKSQPKLSRIYMIVLALILICLGLFILLFSIAPGLFSLVVSFLVPDGLEIKEEWDYLNGYAFAFHDPFIFMEPFFRSIQIILPSALIATIVALVFGFWLGFLKPRRSQIWLLVLTAFLFLSPSVLFLPLFFVLRTYGLYNDLASVSLPFSFAPWAVLLTTYYYRGIRTDYRILGDSKIHMDVFTIERGVFWNSCLFALLLLSLNMVIMLNSIVLPMFTMTDLLIEPLNLIIDHAVCQHCWDALITLDSSVAAVLLSVLQLLPILIFISCSIILFPRLSILMRRRLKNGELEPYEINPEELSWPQRTLVEANGPAVTMPTTTAPTRLDRMKWILVGALLICLGLGAFRIAWYFRETVDINLVTVLITLSIIWLFAEIQYLVKTYDIHQRIALATGGIYPISPWKAVGFHFIPIFNIYWVFKWPERLNRFIAGQVPHPTAAGILTHFTYLAIFGLVATIVLYSHFYLVLIAVGLSAATRLAMVIYDAEIITS